MGSVEYSIANGTETTPSRERVERTATSLDMYLNRIRQSEETELLTAEQEVEHFQNVEAGLLADAYLDGRLEQSSYSQQDLELMSKIGRRSRNQLITSNLRLVVSIAKKFAWDNRLMEDYVQEGNVALFRAVEKFDYTTGNKFSTYAHKVVKNRLIRYVKEFPPDSIIRMPDPSMHDLYKVRVARDKILGQKGEEPSVAEISEEVVDLTVQQIENYLMLCRQIQSLDWTAEDGESFGDWVSDADMGDDPTAEAALNKVIAEQIAAIVEERVGSYDTSKQRSDSKMKPETMKKALKMRYGLGCQAMKVTEVGDKIGTSRNNMSKMLSTSLSLLAEDETLKEIYQLN